MKRMTGMSAGLVTAVLMATVGCSGAGAYSKSPVITVDKPKALFDEPVRLRVNGLAAGQRVTISAAAEDRKRTEWRSEAVFRANGEGVVDLERARPLEGTYRMTDAMGLFWSMRATKGRPPGFGLELPQNQDSFDVDVTVSSGGKDIAQRTLTRIRMKSGVRHRPLTVAEDEVHGTLYLPPKGSPRAAPVLLFGGSDGGDRRAGVAALLASRGHPALSLCYFRCPDRPDRLEDIELEYFVTAAELLVKQDTAAPEHLVVMGTSRGSEAAQLLGQNYPRTFEDVVVFASSNRVHGAFPDSGSAWAKDGAAIPENAWIPLDRVRGTVLGVVGGEDGLWPAESLSLPIWSSEHRLLTYPKAGHRVGGPPYLPEDPIRSTHPVDGNEMDLGGSRPANAAAKAHAWPRILQLIRG